MQVMLASISATAYGGQSASLTTVYSNRPCRLVQLSMAERDLLQREGVESTHKIFCEADMTLSTQHQIVIGGLTYEVTGYSIPEGAVFGHHSEIVVNRKT